MSTISVKGKQRYGKKLDHDMRHSAVIMPSMFEEAQIFMTARHPGKNRQSSTDLFSGMIKCGHCGSWYGSKVWHSNDKYRRVAWQCNHILYSRETVMEDFLLAKSKGIGKIKKCGAKSNCIKDSIYIDNGETGTDFSRPGFERMMDQVRDHGIDCIVVKDLSRFGRNYVEAGYYLEKIFPYLGVRFVSVNDGYDTLMDGDGNEIVLSLKNLVNDLYARDISNKIIASFHTKRKNGEFIGTFPPYGYRKSPEDRHKLTIEPEAAEVVREIFRLREEGAGAGRIVRKLNEESIPSPALYYYRKDYTQKEPQGAGRLWKESSVRRILGNPVYAGHMVQGRTSRSRMKGLSQGKLPPEEWSIVKHTHRPIIDQETFDRVQELGEQSRRQSLAMRGRHETGENIYRGLMVCSECGRKMTRKKIVSAKGAVRYVFVCEIYQQNRGRQGCSKKYVREQDVQEAVREFLRLRIQLASEPEQEVEQEPRTEPAPGQGQVQQRKHCGRETEFENKISNLQQRIRHNTALRSTLCESLWDGALTKEEYHSLKLEYDRKAMELEGELEKVRRERREYREKLSSCENWLASLKEGRGEKTVTRKLALELVRSIRVSGYNELEIIWNFRDEWNPWQKQRTVTGRRHSDGNGCVISASFQ